ncbi:MAG: DUF4411 family protein [Actinomycetales bacterium]|nr:DUF4411 family protein [Actinomycetales bacterium]
MTSIAAPGQLYSFDTSALIDGIERFYPLANFPGIWAAVDELTSIFHWAAV